MDGYDFDGYDDYSTYNGDYVHDSWVDDMYNAGVGSAFVGLNNDSLLNDCLRDVEYHYD